MATDPIFDPHTPLDRLLQAPRRAILALVAFQILALAFTEWLVNLEYSLGILYALPVLLAGLAMNRTQIVLLALLCAAIRGNFAPTTTQLETILRFAMATIAYIASGLLIIELRRNRQLYVSHLAQIEKQQSLRWEAEEQLRVLVESSPAAIMTIDDKGQVLAANRATHTLLGLNGDTSLIGRPIRSYMPLFSDALRADAGLRGFRTNAQCWGKREDGSAFVAQTWFSTYVSDKGKRLAAIAVDSSDEMRDREEQHLHQLLRNNRVLASAVSHEIRNLCAAATIVSTNLERVPVLANNEDFRSLQSLIDGLHNLASFELESKGKNDIGRIQVGDVLDKFGIISRPSWEEIGGVLAIDIPETLSPVLADPHELLQVFLNLAQNSHRAVQESDERRLLVTVSQTGPSVSIVFHDSGPGVKHTSALFQAFQSDADMNGLGLYVSRALLRSFRGDLLFEPSPKGARFRVDLRTISVGDRAER
jgi:PAS domain S-box-containing protein